MTDIYIYMTYIYIYRGVCGSWTSAGTRSATPAPPSSPAASAPVGAHGRRVAGMPEETRGRICSGSC